MAFWKINLITFHHSEKDSKRDVRNKSIDSNAGFKPEVNSGSSLKEGFVGHWV